jgi:hypothetical protein
MQHINETSALNNEPGYTNYPLTIEEWDDFPNFFDT